LETLFINAGIFNSGVFVLLLNDSASLKDFSNGIEYIFILKAAWI
jgi:hypothetical protein